MQLPNRLHEKFPRASGLLGPDVPGSLSDQGLDLLKGLLRLDPAKRLTAAEALNHPWCALFCIAPTQLHFMCPDAQVPVAPRPRQAPVGC